MSDDAKQSALTVAIGKLIAYMLANKPDLFFSLIRNIKPILSLGASGPVFVTRFDDVQEVLSRPEEFNVTYAPMMDPSVGPFMLARDRTEINWRDKGVMRSVMRLEDVPDIKAKTSALVDEALKKEQYENNQFNVVSTLSRWVPARMTEAYFGFPGPSVDDILRWSRTTQYDMFHNLDNDEEIHEANIKSGQEMQAYLRSVIDSGSPATPSDTIFGRLLNTKFDSEIGFDQARVVTNVIGTLVGGIETTSQAVVQILDQIFNRPKILKEMQSLVHTTDDELIAKYCWEALRFNPINPFVVRKCAKDYRVGKGHLRSSMIKSGATVFVSTRSAMRDGRQLDVPSSFVVDRPAYHYMHFGYGEHTCLGAQVAMAEIPQIVKGVLKLPEVRPVGEIEFNGGPFPEEYNVAFG